MGHKQMMLAKRKFRRGLKSAEYYIPESKSLINKFIKFDVICMLVSREKKRDQHQ